MRPMLALVGLAGALLATLLRAPAVQAADGVQLSRDGQSWSGELDGPLFGPEARWVPGDRRIADLWVRNAGPGPADLTVSTTVGGAGLIADDAVDVRLRPAGGTWRDVVAGTGIVDTGDLAEGDGIHYELEAAFSPSASAGSERSSIWLVLDVALEGRGLTAGDESGHSPLPDAGSPVTWWLLVGAGVMLGAGVGLLVAGRRPRRDERHD